MFWKTYRFAIIVSLISMGVAFLYGGLAAFATVALLGIMEICLSADNAIVSARIVEKLSDKWQKLFLTVGILIAVFGVRFVAPVLIVSLVSGMGPGDAIRLALEKGDPEVPGTYGHIMHDAHPVIAAFGGIFLLLIFLNFIFEEKEHYWIKPVEKLLVKLGNIEDMPIIIASAIIFVFTALSGDIKVGLAGVAGLFTYLAVNALGSYFENKEDEALEADSKENGVTKLVGKAAFFSFLYLEVLDASFSLDGVVAAFAITPDPVLIGLGLGLVGALFVRSTTIYLVHQGTLDDFVYLDHGAHWAIGSLAAVLFVSMAVPVPEVVTGLMSVAILVTAVIMSVQRNKRLEASGVSPEPEHVHHEGLGKNTIES